MRQKKRRANQKFSIHETRGVATVPLDPTPSVATPPLMGVYMTERELSYGEKAVGLTFNPSGDSDVNKIKAMYAGIIDEMHRLRVTTEDSEQGRLASVAITQAQTAQMWAVKALTWKA